MVDDTEEPRSLQQPKLLDLESDLHVTHAALIAEVEKKFASDVEFPCCSCKRLLQRKQVTAFAFSDAKFCSNMWKSLKAHILEGDSEANTKTHYVCQYCRPLLNKNGMPSRCILNGLMTEPVPKELELLGPLSKQIIQRGKAFQAVFRLGTYTGNVPNHSNMWACIGTMFFLPLPLEKTLKTIEEVEKEPGEATAGLPDPELFIIFNGKPFKNKILWQSIVNVDHIKAAVLKLKEINWLYADVDNSSSDDASQRVI